MDVNSVILLESNSAVVQQLKDAFAEKENFKIVYLGDDGDEGIKQIFNLKPDLVIVSLFLKGTDGSGVIRAVKRAWPTAKMIATGVATDSFIESAINAGADYYLVKPFSIQMAMERFSELLDAPVKAEKEAAPREAEEVIQAD